MSDDRELLAAYVRDGSEDAFGMITRRYLDLVYSAALRQVRDPEQARDVAQAVFVLLARKAKDLSPATVLPGWLYQSARFVSREALRAERRRKLREETMTTEVPVEPASPEQLWDQVSPHLDEAMAKLPDGDRDAIVLRYFEERSMAELAAALGTSEEAAKKRVSRAVDKLRALLAQKGIHSSAALLGMAMAAGAVQSTPSAMAGIILSGAAAQAMNAALTPVLVKGAIQMITYTKIQAGAAIGAVLLLLGSTGYVTVQRIHARQQLRTPPPRPALAETPVIEQGSALAAAEKENQELRRQSRELYQLRDAVTQLSAAKGRAPGSSSAMISPQAPRELQQAAEQLRELQFRHFITAGQKALELQPLTPEERDEYAAEIHFMKNIGLGLRIYSTDHGDEFPQSMDVLFGTDIIDKNIKEHYQNGRYEYNRFARAESKPELPAVWFAAPDERGIRVLVMNDGSAQMIREPQGVPKPGRLPVASK